MKSFMKFYVDILKMETYCVRERKKTQCIPGTEEMIDMKRNRLML